VNPNKHPKVRKELGQTFIDWLISREGQRAIANYKIGDRQMFFPNANDPNALKGADGGVAWQMVMSALHLKADMCGATSDVCFGPKADIPCNTRVHIRFG
jgi:hypothetical protein